MTAATARKTSARGEARPDAELRPLGVVVELAVVDDPVLDADVDEAKTW